MSMRKLTYSERRRSRPAAVGRKRRGVSRRRHARDRPHDHDGDARRVHRLPDAAHLADSSIDGTLREPRVGARVASPSQRDSRRSARRRGGAERRRDAVDARRSRSIRRDVRLRSRRAGARPRVARVRAGERLAIVGRSGEGKSTIADLLVRQLDPQGGAVCSTASTCAPRASPTFAATCWWSTTSRLSFMPRSPRTFGMRGPTRARRRRGGRGIGRTDAADRASAERDSHDGRRARTCAVRRRASTRGDRARVSRRPDLLVLDEATGALDPATEAQVAAGYEAVMENRTTIIITHRLELARRAERVVVLESGRVVEEGSAELLLSSDESSFSGFFASGARQLAH